MKNNPRFAVLWTMLACTAMSVPVAAHAQAQPGMVIMRKVITLKPLKPGEETPPEEAGQFRKVPTLVAPMTLEYPFPNGQFVFSTAISGVECQDLSGAVVSQKLCENLADPSDVGLIPISASGNPYLRKVLISPDDIVARAPTVRNAQDLCTSAVHVNGQVWWLTCRAQDLQQTVVKVPTSIQLPVQDSLEDGTLTLVTPPADVQCMDARTGQMLDQGMCASAPNPPNVGTVEVPVTAQPAIKTAVVSRGDIKALIPAVTDRNLDEICSSKVTAGSATWQLSCDPDDLRIHFMREATYAVAQNLVGQTPTDGKPNFTGTMAFSTDVRGVVCRDTDSGAPVSASYCESLPPTPGVGTLSVAATYSPAFRTVVFDSAALTAQVPKITNMSELCRSSVYMDGGEGAPREFWYVRCDPAAISGDFVKVATAVVAINTPIEHAFPTSGGSRFAGQVMVNTAASGVICRDASTGKTAADASRCANLENPAGVGTFSIAGSFVPSLRKVLVNFDDVLRVSPEIANRDAFCGSAVAVTGVVASGAPTSEGWRITCNAEDVREHYERYSTEVLAANSPVSISLPSTGRENFDGEIVVTSGTSGVQCRDTDNGQAVSYSNCLYLNSPALTTFPVPAKFSPTYAKAYVDFDAIQARLPDVQNRTSFCSSSLTITGVDANGAAARETWRITCDLDDVRPHHLKVPTTPQVASTWIQVAGPTTGQDNFMAPLNFTGLSGIMCRDLDTSAFVSSSFCDRLSVPAEQASFTVQAQFGPSSRKAYVNFDDILKIIPAATNKTALCSGSTRFNVYPTSGSAESWTLTCDPEDVRPHYERVTTDINTGSMGTYPSVNSDVIASGSANYETTVRVTPSSSYTCRDTDNGATVAIANCQYLAVPPAFARFEVKGTVSPSTRKILISRDELRAKLPTASDANLVSVCKADINISVNGSNYGTDFTSTCDPEDVRLHYERLSLDIGTSSIVTQSGVPSSDLASGAPNFDMNVSMASNGSYVCRDTDNGAIVPNSNCSYYKNENGFGFFNVKGVISPSMRKVYVDRSEILASMPRATNIDAVCKASVGIRVNGSNNTTSFPLTCDPEDVRLHYERVPTDISTSTIKTNSTISTALLDAGDPNFDMGIWMAPSGTYTCRDTDNGATVANSRCSYLSQPSTFSAFVVDGIVSPSTRKVYFNAADLAARLPTASSANIDAVCKAAVEIRYANSSGASTDYKATCSKEDIRLHYEKVANALLTGYDNIRTNTVAYASVGTGKPDIPVTLSMGVSSSYACRDTDNGQMVTSSLCAYYGLNEGFNTLSVPATLSQDSASPGLVVSRADIVARIPGIANMDAVCSASGYLKTSGGGSYSRKIICQP